MKVGIIGGGVAGLSTAYYLQKNGYKDITIYEKASEIGGLAGTLTIEGHVIEKFYHHIFTHDKYLIDLVKELGIEDKLIWKETKMGYNYDKITYPFSGASDLLKFKPMNFFNRIRFGATSLFISFYKNMEKLENMTSEDFFRPVVGKQSWDVIWRPMMEAKFGKKAKNIPAIWLWERIAQRFKSRGKAGAKEYLGYMEGSFQTFLTVLAEMVTSSGVKVVTSADVQKYMVEDGTCKGIQVNGEVYEYDMIINTAALPLHMKMLPTANMLKHGEELLDVKYDGVVCLILVLYESLSQYYWTNMSDNDICFGGLIEHTNFIDSSNYGGKHIVYLSKYLDQKDEMFSKENEEVLDIFVKDIKKIFKDFDKSKIHSFEVAKALFAQPLWPLNYSKIKPEFKTEINNLYISNTSQIYPNDRGMNFSVMLGKKVCEVIINDK